MKASNLARTGPLLLFGLVVVAAATSLFGPEPVQRLTGSPWFAIPAALAIAVGVGAAATRRAPALHRALRTAVHLGVAAGIGGLWLAQNAGRSGHAYLEERGGPGGRYLTAGFASSAAVPLAVRLDSIGELTHRGFQPAPTVWLRVGGEPGSVPVTWNRPLNRGRWQLVFSRMVAPGFPLEYQVELDGERLTLLHNQRLRLPDGAQIASSAFDPDESSIGLAVGDSLHWLRVGESVRIGDAELVVESISFATGSGAILLVRDTRFLPVAVAGIALALVALIGTLMVRRKS